jgi:hypothetical protein
MIPSVKEEVDPLSEAKSQVWFIETFAKPLFDLTATGIPGPSPICSHTAPFPADLVFDCRDRKIREQLHRELGYLERKGSIAFHVR